MRAAVAAIALCATTARADVPWPRLVLDDDQVEVAATLEVSIATAPFARPTSLAPDLWWGATPRLTIGLTHSHASVDQIAAGASLCLRTADLGCDRTYRGSNLDARYLVYEDHTVSVAPRARLLLRDIDPVKPALTLGATARWRHGRYAIAADPYLQLGLYNRDKGNHAQLWLPVYLEVTVACRWLVAAHVGWNSELIEVNDAWHLPLGGIVRVRATSFLDVGLEAGFSTLGGPQNNIKQRAAMFTVAWHD